MNSSQSLKLDIYLNYPGHCEEAFRFYEQHLGGQVQMMLPHQQLPPHFPATWTKPIMHAIINIGGMLVRGADVPGAEPMRSAYLTLRPSTEEQAQALYKVLADGAEIFVKMEKNFFANRFAMLRDRFGTSWMILHET